MNANCAPVLTCPVNVTVDCLASTDPLQTGTPTMTDICDPNPSLIYIDEVPGGDCGGASNVTRTWIASNDCGFADTCVQIISVSGCQRIVSNSNDSGAGSLRQQIECATNGDTIFFHPSLAGQQILLSSSRIIIDKDIIIHSTLVPPVMVQSSTTGLFEIAPGADVKFNHLSFRSAQNGAGGLAFKNFGNLSLHNVIIIRHPSAQPLDALVNNHTGSQIHFSGNCRIDFD
jgi:hypothetical protein